jgi:phenylalanine-4-hydroxylase
MMLNRLIQRKVFNHKNIFQRCLSSEVKRIGTLEERASIYFSIKDRVGALEDILATLRKLHISLSGIESRPSKSKGHYDFYVDFVSSPELVKTAVEALQSKSTEVRVVSAGENDAGAGSVPWFPRKITDLDTFAEKVLSYGAVGRNIY